MKRRCCRSAGRSILWRIAILFSKLARVPPVAGQQALAAAGRAARDSAKSQACASARPRLKRSVRRICGRRKRTRKEMSGATNRSALLNTGLGVPVELCPDAPGDNDLSPGTWTRRHRSQIVSDRNLVKSSSKEDVSDYAFSDSASAMVWRARSTIGMSRS